MKWTKKGLIYAPDGSHPWMRRSALQPTPLLLKDDVIRLYVGFRDDNGVGRIGYVDVDGHNPSRVLRVSPRPVLDIGIPGTFDENGVIPSAIVRNSEQIYLYYAGYQLGRKIRFTVFGGLALSNDGGETFTRHSPVPVLDRTRNELFFRVAHSVLIEDGVWRVWYGGGSTWIEGAKKSLPVYDIRYMESRDGVTFPAEGKVCLANAGDEHRVGRPYVIRHAGLYKMFYSVGTESKTYRLGYAESPDGIRWTRKDDQIGLTVSDSGWDSEMMAYTAVVQCCGNTYLFYNGNNYGETGFGYAVLDQW